MMKKVLLGAAFALVLAACSGKDPVYWYNPVSGSASAAALVPYYPAKPVEGQEAGDVSDSHAPAGYQLVWNEEFTSQASLYSNWTFEEGGHGWGNAEEQYYCPGGYYTPTLQQTASVSDGTLKIKAFKLQQGPYPGNDCHYISARMNTKEGWTHGYIEMKAKLPLKLGSWSAFWMLLKDGPSYVMNEPEPGAEIDIMEHVPADDPHAIYFSAHSYNATAAATHNGGRNSGYVDPVSGVKYSYCQSGNVSDASQWHCYGMEWTHEFIKGFIDGVQYFYVPNPTPSSVDLRTWPFDQEMYLKLNLAVGGSWGGTPAADFNGETFEVDWVRVFEYDGSTVVPEPTTTAEKLAAHQWELTDVKEQGVSVTSSLGNMLTLNSDHTLAFNCTANGGQTFDHTWEGSLIAPDTYGAVSGMNWYTYSDGGKDYLGITNGYLLVFVQEGTEEYIYEILELDASHLTVAITTYDEVWTLFFEAV